MRKMMLLVGAGVGYVLGARAGRERYEQIAGKANQVWGDPRVQERVEGVKQTAPELANKAAENAKTAAEKARARVTGQESTKMDGSYANETGSYDPDLGSSVDTSGLGSSGGTTGYDTSSERLP